MAWSSEQQQAWLDQIIEDILDPDRPIVDPHPVSYTHLTLPTTPYV